MRRPSSLWVACLLWATVGHAHTHLLRSAPSDHAELAVAPTEATLTFAEAVILTAAKLEAPDGSQRSLKPLPQGAVKQAEVPLPTLGPGSYVLKWRASSDDGHVMSGEIHFIVNGSAPPQR